MLGVRGSSWGTQDASLREEQGRGESQVMPTIRKVESVVLNGSLMGDVLVRGREEWDRE